MAAPRREEPSEAAWLARVLHAVGKGSDWAVERSLQRWLPALPLPSAADVEGLVGSADNARDTRSLDEVLQDFSSGAAAIDRQASAQMTVGALSLTVLGLSDDVDKRALIPVAICALIGVVLARFALLNFVGHLPGTRATMKGALEARTLFLRKFGFVTLSQFFILLTIIGAAAVLVFSD